MNHFEFPIRIKMHISEVEPTNQDGKSSETSTRKHSR